jgi:hypothetical protein
MKTSFSLLSLLLAVLLLGGCISGFSNRNIKIVNPSNTIVTQDRAVNGFNGIDFSTFGKVTVTQGDRESLTIKGSDNIVPLVKTSVQNDILRIWMDEDINPSGLNSDNMLTFTIAVKNLNSLTVSGAGQLTMGTLSTNALSVTMSGAGNLELSNLTAESLHLTISGVGGVELSGKATSAKINLSGAGGIEAPNLQLQTADITLSGLGGSTLWVTDKLTGEISGAGGVSYYGSPQTNTKTTGVGNFNSLGNK